MKEANNRIQRETERGHLDTAGQHILCTPDGLAESLVLPSGGEVERLAPPVLIEVRHKVVETMKMHHMRSGGKYRGWETQIVTCFRNASDTLDS